MPVNIHPQDLPVLLLHNVDPAWTADERSASIDATEQLASALKNVGHPVTPLAVLDTDIAAVLSPYDPDDAVVFNWCEEIPGIPHSEARVAEIIESLNFVYTGSDREALSLCEDKLRVKHLLREAGIPTPDYRFFESPEPNAWRHFPAIIKPSHEHCSIGITSESVVMTEEELLRRVEYVIDTYHQPALVEDFIDGREFRVSIWGNTQLLILPPAEMDFSAFDDVRERLCTYDAKFVPESAHYRKIETLLPASLTDAERRRLERVSRLAYRTLGCRDYARIDIRLRNGIFFVLDVNPNADISADASMAYAAEKAGYSYGAMGSYIARLAARRHTVFAPRRRRRRAEAFSAMTAAE